MCSSWTLVFRSIGFDFGSLLMKIPLWLAVLVLLSTCGGVACAMLVVALIVLCWVRFFVLIQWWCHWCPLPRDQFAVPLFYAIDVFLFVRFLLLIGWWLFAMASTSASIVCCCYFFSFAWSFDLFPINSTWLNGKYKKSAIADKRFKLRTTTQPQNLASGAKLSCLYAAYYFHTLLHAKVGCSFRHLIPTSQLGQNEEATILPWPYLRETKTARKEKGSAATGEESTATRRSKRSGPY